MKLAHYLAPPDYRYNFRFLANLATAKEQTGDYNGAVTDATKSIELQPMYSLAYAIRGQSKYKLGQKSSACKDYKQSARLGSERVRKFLGSMRGKWCADEIYGKNPD